MDEKRSRHPEFGRAVLDSITAHVAIIDAEGIIVETNKAWMTFAQANQIGIRPDMVGLNYLDICDSAEGEGDEIAHNVADGIREVISGRTAEFVLDYPCHSATEERWFNLRATRLNAPGPLRIVVSHENVTNIKKAQEAIQRQQETLARQNKELMEVNAALKVLLRRREEDKKELEQKVQAQATDIIKPCLEELKSTDLNQNQLKLVDLLLTHLNDITSPFANSLASKRFDLTPMEIKTAVMIREGYSTKEISSTLNLSQRTIDFHRMNLRRKFGLNNSKSNLRTFLLSLNDE